MISSVILTVLAGYSSAAFADEAPKKRPDRRRPNSPMRTLEKKPVLAGDFSETPKNIIAKRSLSDKCERACLYAAKREYGGRSSARRWLRVSQNDCRLTLVDDWMKTVYKKNDSKAVIGEVSCVYTLNRPYRGRLPSGNLTPLVEPNGLATHFARAAQEEALSVYAFQQLAQRLTELGAPIELVSRSLIAASEEREHAAFMLQWAIDAGSIKPPISSPNDLPQSLFELTLHNAVHGCVNESWAALLACASTLNSPESMRVEREQIAMDELSHADLAFDIHAYLMGLLSEVEQQAVLTAMSDAIDSLSKGISQPHADCVEIGEPDEACQRLLMTDFQQQLHSQIRRAVVGK